MYFTESRNYFAKVLVLNVNQPVPNACGLILQHEQHLCIFHDHFKGLGTICVCASHQSHLMHSYITVIKG